MASTFKAITDTMNDMEAVVWKVIGKGGALLGYQNDPKMDVDGSENRLRKLLEQQSGDMLRVELHPVPKKGAKGGDMMKVIKMDVDLSTVRNNAVQGIGNAPGADLSAMQKMIKDLTDQNIKLQSQLIEEKYQAQITDLKKQIDGIGDQDPIGKIVEMVAPILAAYLPSLLNPKQQTSQVHQKDINGLPGDDLLQRLQQVDPDGYRVLNAVVVIAETDPDAYAMYKPILINFADGK